MNAPVHPLDAGADRRAQLMATLGLSHHGADTNASATAAPSPAGPVHAPHRRVPAWALAALGLQTVALAALVSTNRSDALPGLLGAQATAAPAPAAAPTAPRVAVPGVRFEASGFVAATRTATVSARTLGQVSEVFADEGTLVKRGQVLARMADQQARTEFGLAQAQLAAAQARLGAAQAQLDEARRDLDREQSLRDQNFTSESRLSKSKTSLDVALSNLASAKADAALGELQVQRQAQALEDYTVRAPFDGVVLARNAQVGEIVAPGGAGGGYTRTGIYTIVDMHSLELVVDVNEDLLSKVEPGRKVSAELYSHKGWQVAGEVLRVMPNADRAKSTVRVRIKLLDEDPRILPDMAVKVLFL
ncbi:efflux RND transporter periplasmic adaptor subunit [Roseateles sp. BYS96W]|uniref:Efflux RND transporter periplasmic adaptor subunit n=1 Tax=Pelomonas nitida TaxID=3299027 RepID=A0ABW7GA39_9BURK